MPTDSLRSLAAVGAALAVLSCAPKAPEATAAKPTPEAAKAFVDGAEATLYDRTVEAGRAAWVQENFITVDTETIAAQAQERLISEQMRLAGEAAKFAGLELPYDVDRKLNLLKTAITLPAPKDPAKASELTETTTSMTSLYGKGQYCPPGKECMDLGALSSVIAKSRKPDELLEAWQGWHAVARPIRPKYQRFVELSNEGARELGFADTGALWRSGYDMDPDAFAAELDRLWNQVKPLYESLHCYTRGKLAAKYGPGVIQPDGMIPAHLLGNMWAQTWANVSDVVSAGDSDPGYDLTKILQREKYDAKKMVQTGEAFFTSLGFDPLPATFWERSLFVQPQDRDVVCHASAWSIDEKDDLRIKMCIEINDEDFATVHHELGHNFYQRAYNSQPFLYHNSANDGFHEAIGDTIALSVTPAYLVKLGLLDKEPPADADVGLLLKLALDKVAFLPFGLLIDQWRWKVFSGEIAPGQYNQAWWDLRAKYQGVMPPVARTEEDFDAGAKYHVPANTPYTRYFLAHILQFQFHRDLCRQAGITGPLHRCSIYGNKEVGERLEKMLAMGASRPWPEALEALTGSKQMDASAVLDYFAPLKTWLDEQNQDQKCGW
ncbi:MAG: M2 family metallopeptidase [Thermoanaerobaculia bacterium]|nr:M2 family metallopeptidase [Thermoanaerobaculia bacterium]